MTEQPSPLSIAAAYTLEDIERFSRYVLRMPLYAYQAGPLRAIIDSVLERRGLEFLLVFPRQSGKNEAIAHLLVYLLTLLQVEGGQIVYGAIGDGLGRGTRRLEERLDSPLTRGQWRRSGRPRRYTVGRAAVVFVSSHPGAATRGETADHLLVIDEAQDQDAAHIEAVFTPMRAARNATAAYLGTVRTTGDFLWQKKGELEAAQAADGRQRVFLVGPEQVTAANPHYAAFLAEQVRRYGRRHPIIAAEYFLEPLDGAGGLFPPWRAALMAGRHERQRSPRPGEVYVAAIDPAGGDAAAGSGAPGEKPAHPGRDFTVATVFRVAGSPDGGGPVYEAVDVLVDQGSRHFQAAPGESSLAERLLAALRHWSPAHTIIDASGVGQGLADWLGERLGRGRLTAVTLNGASKARLGSDFLALVDTGRFKYWTGDEDTPLSDGWWFRQQVTACGYSVTPGGRFDRDLRWGVPESARVATPAGSERIHDDRLLSAALVAELEQRRAAGRLLLGEGVSRVVGPGELGIRN